MQQDRCHLSQIITTFFVSKGYWLALALISFIMEAVALYFQHILGEEPCQVCIHIRIWTAGFMLLSLLMLAIPKGKISNIIGHGINTACMGGLWERCWFLLEVENGNATSSCNFFLNFPSWFALDKWFPELFEVRNLCGLSPELLFGVTMAQGLIVLSSALVIGALIALAFNLVKYPR